MATSARPPMEFFAARKVIVTRTIYLLGAMAAVPLLFTLSGEPLDAIVLAMLGAVFALSMAVVLWAFRRVRLVVTPEGVEMRSIGFSTFSRWDNIEGIGSRIVYGEGRVEGFLLKTPGLKMNTLLQYGRFTSIGAYLSMSDYEQFIPISNLLTDDWRCTPLSDAIRRYAPHLLESH